MSSYQCSSCGRETTPAVRCPHCGAEQGPRAEDIAQIERSIAEMKAREAAIASEQRQIAAKMQAALFQRDILAHANAEKIKQSTRPRRVLRRRIGQRPPTAGTGGPPRVPRQGGPAVKTGPGAAPPPGNAAWLDVDDPEHPPEASSREVQNVLLVLGALLLGVAAVVFTAMAIGSLDDLSRVAILLTATIAMLLVPPVLARRGLTATAETVAAVGLLLVLLDGYVLRTVDQLRFEVTSGTRYAAGVFLATAAVGFGYAVWTGLRVPRYAAVLALQPVLPLLAYDLVTGPAGWALVLAVLAAVDLALLRLAGSHRPGLLTERVPDPVAPAAARTGAPPPGPGTPDDGPASRPETDPEEVDAVLHGAGPARPATAAPVPGLPQLTGLLHGAAVVLALAFAVAALVLAGTVGAALAAGAALVLAAAVSLAGALTVGTRPLPDLAAGICTLAVIGALGRLASVALPGRALLLIALVIAGVGVAVRALPEAARRGPQLAAALALTVSGLVVAGGAVRAGLAPIQAALPAWAADLDAYPGRLAASVGPAAWQLATTAFLLTVAAVLSLPAEIRREFAVAGVVLTAVAVPASFGLGWATAPWPPVLAAVGIGLTGLWAGTRRAAQAHVVGAGLVGAAGAGAALARPGLTAAVLFALAAAGVLAMVAPRVRNAPASADLVSAWGAGAAAFALPGAVAAAVASAVPVDPVLTPAGLRAVTVPVLAASFLAVCVTLGYAAVVQVSQRQIDPPLAVGTGLGALAVSAAAFSAPGATSADAWVGALLLIAATLLVLAPSIDAGRRADHAWDGADLAAAAATAALVGTLARIATILAPGALLAVAAALVLTVAVGARAMPADWRRGPMLGIAVSGGVIGLFAGYHAVVGGVRALANPGAIWAADLSRWPIGPAEGPGWEVPVALLLLAGATAILLPAPWRYDVPGALVALATVGAPAALGLTWWSPVVLGTAVATAYAAAAVSALDPRAALSRVVVAAVVALHAVGAGLARPWSTAAALGLVALIGVMVAVLARIVAGGLVEDVATDGMPAHLGRVGGAGTAAALLALPGAVAAAAAGLGSPAEVMLSGALAASSLGVAVLALVRTRVPHFLPYATVGVAGGATITALASLPTDLPVGVYAAGAALLGVLAELVRASTTPPPDTEEHVNRWSVRGDGSSWATAQRWRAGQWSTSPGAGALAAAALPTALALASVTPTLVVALVEPYRTLNRIWQGPPPELVTPPADVVDVTHVLAALLLTVAAGLAATGFSGGRPARAVPVVLPGAAVTLLITPTALGMGWPNSTLAALTVFVISMLGLALTPPPPPAERARSLRTARVLVFVIGLAGGGAGLAGSLATRGLTLLALGGAVAVGAVAALAGATQRARILGWLFASVMGQLFVLTAGLVTGLPPVLSAFGVLAVGAALMVLSATLPRLRRVEAYREAATVEWSGYAAALIALALAFDSPRHIAALLAGWGAVLGVAATRPGRGPTQRRVLFWAVVACEIVAWWILMRVADVALPEAYTLPFAALALLVGLLEVRQRPELGSWVAYGPALVTAFLPTLVIVLFTESGPLRQVLLLLGGVVTLIFGSISRQQAPVVVGATVTAIAALHALFSLGQWLVLIPVGLVLLVLGAGNERRRRTQERLQTALRAMR
ncbi:SCO7613 C-terminal domain-containing membrane protein [Micromonospora echinofusca]|uniref:Permease n=1 Tax=Micromonospora echinofusca TaxID=47858 RepID=A0ABS3VNW7_MICEH|nr:permease [Micromonospora echinofusca]MBO4206186.1 permease [Micromonospora echinofusca]